jgi:thiol:disulfide interchange protein
MNMSAREFTSASIPSRGKVFGIPLGDLGLFSSLLMAFAFGFLVFFLTCFLSIFGLLFYNAIGHHSVDMADSYRYIAFPCGLVALAVALITLLTLWVRRKIAGR